MSLARKGAALAEALKKISQPKTFFSYNELRVIVAIERAVARLLSNKTLANALVFKGGFVLLKTIATTRFTKDLDAVTLGLSQSETSTLIQKSLEIDLDDGIWYGKAIVEELAHSPYPGLRFSIPFQIGEPPNTKGGLAKLNQIYVDIVFSSIDETTAINQVMHPLLVAEKPISWSIYPPEYIFSEKLEALMSLGSFNSRAKDIYDLVMLYDRCPQKNELWNAIRSTFKTRKTALPPSLHQAAYQFELTSLKRAWVGLSKDLEAMSFDDIWKLLLGILENLDAQNNAKP